MIKMCFKFSLYTFFIIGWSSLTSAELTLSGSESNNNAACGDAANCSAITIQNISTNKTQDSIINLKLIFLPPSGANDTEAAKSSFNEKRTAGCGDVGDCPAVDTECNELCGCDKNIPTTFNSETQECEINLKLLINSLTEKYDTGAKIRGEADRIFKGVIVAAFFFIACAATCTITACIYCCRINYSDYRLKKQIKVLAKKFGKRSVKKPADKPPTAPIAESCNVVVEDAGVFCV